MATLVERKTRYVILARLNGGRTADELNAAIKLQFGSLPAPLRQSLTWDQGKEISGHKQLRAHTGLDVYVCDPHSPWQRGTNENTNGLLRQYLPRSTNLYSMSQADFDLIAESLNQRPRQTLGWMTPSQAFATAVATTG